MAATENMRNSLDASYLKLLRNVRERYGVELESYSSDALIRRTILVAERYQLEDVEQLASYILEDKRHFQRFISDLFIKVTEMFRDPSSFLAIRKCLQEEFSGLPFIRIWHAGCSTGEEVYSLAILLKELGLYERSHIYATDICHVALNVARRGVYSIHSFQQYCENYRLAGGDFSLTEYVRAKYQYVSIDSKLRDRIIFSKHDLVNDGHLSDVHLIMCRNVLIYFKHSVREKVLIDLSDSLARQGMLMLGNKENIYSSACSEMLTSICDENKIFRIKKETESGLSNHRTFQNSTSF